MTPPTMSTVIQYAALESHEIMAMFNKLDPSVISLIDQVTASYREAMSLMLDTSDPCQLAPAILACRIIRLASAGATVPLEGQILVFEATLAQAMLLWATAPATDG